MSTHEKEKWGEKELDRIGLGCVVTRWSEGASRVKKVTLPQRTLS